MLLLPKKVIAGPERCFSLSIDVELMRNNSNFLFFFVKITVTPKFQVLLGTDSHTCTAGAFGQFATGIGNTDAGFVLGAGKLLLKVCNCFLLKENSSIDD